MLRSFLIYLAAVTISLLLVAYAIPARAQGNSTDEPLRVASFEVPELFVEQRDGYEGFYVDLWDGVAEELAVEYEWIAAESFPSLLEMIQTGEADVGAFHLSITAEREEVMDFSHSVFEDGFQIVVPAGAGSEATILSVLASSNVPSLLLILFVAFLVMAHAIWLAERNRQDSDFSKSYVHGIGDAIWYSLVTFSTVGYGDKKPKGRIGRIVGMVWILFSLLLVSVFVARVTSVFTVAELQSDIERPEDLAGRSVGALEGGIYADYLVETGITPATYESVEGLYQALAQGEVEAVLDARMGTLILPANLRSQVQPVGVPFLLDDIAFGLPQGSPYREPINQALVTMRENGEYDRIFDRWLGNRS
jgi:ABC-type amino acid transport substrate-binding protein